MLRFAAKLTTDPRLGDRAAIEPLKRAGLGDAAIVALAQLVAFLVLPAARRRRAEGDARDARETRVIRRNGFTDESLEWRSWLEPVRLDDATPLQLEVLDESHPQSRTSPYYLTLAHQPLMLRHRSAAYNAIMYAPGGLPRAERELGAMVVSVTNGCVYCTSVHAQRFEQLAKRSDTVEQVFDDPRSAGTTRARARDRPLRDRRDASGPAAERRGHRAAARRRA